MNPAGKKCTVTRIGRLWDAILVTDDGFGTLMCQKCAQSQIRLGEWAGGYHWGGDHIYIYIYIYIFVDITHTHTYIRTMYLLVRSSAFLVLHCELVHVISSYIVGRPTAGRAFLACKEAGGLHEGKSRACRTRLYAQANSDRNLSNPCSPI